MLFGRHGLFSVSRQKEQSKCRQGTGQSSRDKMYVKWFETKMTVLKIFKFAASSGPHTS
ncbi:unnamed protein product [Staurois parvus]|uniref:Uncharacterized protein n=1 Tax=Staurois parvus TaxID=386267 RepID=A0ABN9EVU2_9NEOB|nr:unnamed protein product [Staurois parvus]